MSLRYGPQQPRGFRFERMPCLEIVLPPFPVSHLSPVSVVGAGACGG